MLVCAAPGVGRKQNNRLLVEAALLHAFGDGLEPAVTRVKLTNNRIGLTNNKIGKWWVDEKMKKTATTVAEG